MRAGVSAWNTATGPNHTRLDLDMADPIIPLPDASGYWHFTYITTDSLDGRWYGGKRSTKRHPLSDRYLGSGNWIKAHPARERLRREIVAFFASSTEVFAAEAAMITWTQVFDDPLCMNLRDGGEGVSVEAALARYADPQQLANHVAMLRRVHADPKARAKMSTSARRRFQDPEQLAKQTSHMRRITSDPDMLNKAKAARDTPEWRANVTAANRKKAEDPVWRAKQSAIMRRIMVDR
jgi:hypothetical protein